MILTPAVIFLLMSNSNGSIGGKSGSIGDAGHTCTDCHSGSATPIAGWITTNVPPEGYTPGQTYTITATGTHSGVVKFGFELTVENSLGSKVGTLQIAEPARTKLTNNNHAVTHTSAGNVPSGNTNTWTMNWVAPSNISGNIGIYAAFNAANGNGNTSGDVIYKSSTFISMFTPPAVLVSIDPSVGNQGDSIQVTITGTNTSFDGTESVSLSFVSNGFEIINAESVTAENSTTLHAQFFLPSDASVGLWDLHVDALKLASAFTVNLVTGIGTLSDNGVNLYPNPATSFFYLENVIDADVHVYDSKGSRVIAQKIIDDKQAIDVSSLEHGLYLVKIQSGGMVRVGKLLVN